MDQKRIAVALAGNPNVGKSTIFNGLTGLRQHTGNWPGVTVTTAQGTFTAGEQEYLLVDLPGTYSLAAHSEDEVVARDFLCSGIASVILLVCDATCLERGLHFLKQTLEIEQVKVQGVPVVLCVNLCDEAGRKGILIDYQLLQDVLQIPVVPCCARSADDIQKIKDTIHQAAGQQMHYDCLDFCPKKLAQETVTYTKTNYRQREEFLDRILTGPYTGSLIMVLMLLGVFWLSMAGANYPSQFLWNCLFWLEERLADAMTAAGSPQWLISSLVYGVYRVLAWVISVMLPPMAIFFPLFTLLEDLGYLPRVAFNMDRSFQKCKACGKQCLTMAMGLGCNAAGVVGCRIIDSPRERLIAILTNSLVPCNGRLPTLVTLITIFFVAQISNPAAGSFLSAIMLTLTILLGVAATLGASWILSHTLLKGIPSSFTLELPPYRHPEIKKVIIRSIFDRTLFVLGRAVAVAAPAGLIIWILANIAYTGPGAGWFASAAQTDAPSLLTLFTGFLDPLGNLMGMDGTILAAFILGFPANEIVIPIILMAYLQTGMLTEMTSTADLGLLLASQGWTWVTALCMMIFCLFHWPCSTTCLTIKKETGSLKWTAAAILLPTLLGTLLCILIAAIF
ncbi:ferrous iron transporter B [Lachnoclostridium edouardi]|uniref:ferrous iron transporter B n=1 Tax=Lachnoclostridium edouardi TaxID=1926283 RepID=UPI000C7E00A8|nr:ferrous iron transporter B [Lachnoclostridium edouardi]